MWDEACAMLERATRTQRQFFQPTPSATPSWEPPVDIFETDRDVQIIAALPGVDPQDLAVELDDGEVVIKGVRRLPPLPRDTAVHRLEIPYGRFERRIRLAMAALRLTHSELAAGCLTLRLAKRR